MAAYWTLRAQLTEESVVIKVYPTPKMRDVALAIHNLGYELFEKSTLAGDNVCVKFEASPRAREAIVIAKALEELGIYCNELVALGNRLVSEMHMEIDTDRLLFETFR